LAVAVVGILAVWLLLGSSVDVEVDTASKADIYRSIEDTGKVRSERSLDLPSAGNGKILSILVEIGDKVKAGDLLASIDDKALSYQLQSLDYQIKSLESNISYLAKPNSDLSLANYRASAKIAEENYLKAKSDYENAKTLFEEGAISKSEFDSLELLSTVGEMNYIIASNDSRVASKGGDDDVLNQYDFQLKSLIPQLESLQNQITEYQIKAPFDGTISDIFVEEGESVTAMSSVIQISEDKYYVESNLLEESLVLMEMDAPVEISFDTVVAEGYVRKIHPTIKKVVSDLGVFQQKGIVEIATEHEFRIIGREVNLNFMLSRRQDVLTIDKDALIRRGRIDYVFVAKDNKAELREVSVGAKGNARYEILEGLEENDIVIINSGDEIEDGDSISY
jgi:multidrug efflux pump subunit AcrA (membrane-fusion protein)